MILSLVYVMGITWCSICKLDRYSPVSVVFSWLDVFKRCSTLVVYGFGCYDFRELLYKVTIDLVLVMWRGDRFKANVSVLL